VTVAATYGVGLALVGMWPHPIDDSIDVAGLGPVRWTIDMVGLTAYQGYEVVEAAANVLLLVPFGMLVLLVWRNATVLQATVAGVAVSTLIELLQHLVRPGRIASVQDVVANTIGTAMGAGVVWAVRRRARTGEQAS
jgi:glycopeptide antibiotics resistance protein